MPRCQSEGRMPQPDRTFGSTVRRATGFELPKLMLLSWPHSPLANGFKRSQSGIRLWLASFQPRDAFVTKLVPLAARIPRPSMAGFALMNMDWFVADVRYLPRFTFTAVLPLPNTS